MATRRTSGNHCVDHGVGVDRCTVPVPGPVGSGVDLLALGVDVPALIHEMAIALERELGLDRAATLSAEVAAIEIAHAAPAVWVPLAQLLERRAAAVSGPTAPARVPS